VTPWTARTSSRRTLPTETSPAEADARPVRAAGETICSSARSAGRAGPQGRRAQGVENRRGRPGRRQHPHPEDPGTGVKQYFGKEPHRRQPRTRSWRSAPRCRPACSGRVKDLPTSGRHATVARCGDPGGRHDQAHERNTTIPRARARPSPPRTDNQTSARSTCFKGERELAR